MENGEVSVDKVDSKSDSQQLCPWLKYIFKSVDCALDHNSIKICSKKMLDYPKRWPHVFIKNCFLDYSKRWPHYPSFVSTFGHSISLCRPWKHFTFLPFLPLASYTSSLFENIPSFSHPPTFLAPTHAASIKRHFVHRKYCARPWTHNSSYSLLFICWGC